MFISSGRDDVRLAPPPPVASSTAMSAPTSVMATSSSTSQVDDAERKETADTALRCQTEKEEEDLRRRRWRMREMDITRASCQQMNDAVDRAAMVPRDVLGPSPSSEVRDGKRADPSGVPSESKACCVMM